MKRTASELIQGAALFPSDDGVVEWSPSPPPLYLEEFFLPGALSGFELDDRWGDCEQDEISSFFADGETSILNNSTPNRSNISAIESSSICAGTPTSFHNPGVKVNQALGGTSGSDQSDEESFEIDGGPCEQSTKATDTKRIRRMVSNRESAQRSRMRKQAQLEGLESQVDQLRSDKTSLCKQLTNVNQEFTEAVANNYILKSNVEALRIKVRMAEDLVLVSRGALACSSLDRLLPSNMGSPQFLRPQQPCQSSPDFLPAIDFQEDDSCFIGVPSAEQFHNVGKQ